MKYLIHYSDNLISGCNMVNLLTKEPEAEAPAMNTFGETSIP
jgi:hypothetical protein